MSSGFGITHGEAANFWAARQERERDERLAAAKRIAEGSASDAALRALAEANYPDDFAATAERWGLAVFMREVWTRAYQQAWRDAHFRMFIADDPDGEPSAIRELYEAALPFARAFEAADKLDPNFPENAAVLRASFDFAVATDGVDIALPEPEYLAAVRRQSITRANLRRLAQAVANAKTTVRA